MKTLKLNEYAKSTSIEVKVGDTIHIVKMEGEKNYDGKEGTVEHIDDLGQVHGTWGGCAVIPETDTFYIVK